MNQPGKNYPSLSYKLIISCAYGSVSLSEALLYAILKSSKLMSVPIQTIKTSIMGFGNPVRSDDGIGMYVIEKLAQQLSNKSEISIFDMGTNAFEVLFKLKGHQKIMIVDAVVNTSEPIGTIFKVPAHEIEAAPEDDPLLFLHGMKWNQALSYAKKILGEDYPNDISVYLIAIENTKLDTHLSEPVIESGNKVTQYILDELKSMYQW